MEPDEAARHEVERRLVEPVQEPPDVIGREELELRRVVDRVPPKEEEQPVLEPEAVRDRADERAARPEHALGLGDEPCRLAKVLEHFPGHDHIEALVRERKRLLGVRPVRLDPELGGFGQRLAVDVDADDLVAVEVRLRQRARSAPDVEPAGPVRRRTGR